MGGGGGGLCPMKCTLQVDHRWCSNVRGPDTVVVGPDTVTPVSVSVSPTLLSVSGIVSHQVVAKAG